MRAVFATVVCFAALSAVADARTTWLGEMEMPVPAATIHTSECPHIPSGGSCTVGAEVWIAPTATRFTFAHELGHAFDARTLDARTRNWFTPRLGFPAGHPWESGSEHVGPVEPAEVFADAYAHCALGTRPRDLLGYGYLPGPRRHRKVCNAIALLGLVAAHQSAALP